MSLSPPIQRTADVEMQLILRILPVRDRLLFARTCRRAFALASADSVWRNTPLELMICYTGDLDAIAPSESRCSFRVRPWLRCSSQQAAMLSGSSTSALSDRLAVDNMSHADRLDAMLNLAELDLTRDQYKILRRGQCVWPEECQTKNLSSRILNANEARSLFFKHAAVSLVFIQSGSVSLSEAASRGFLHCIIHYTKLLRSRAVRFAVETVDISAKTEMYIDFTQSSGNKLVFKNETLLTPQIVEMLLFLASDDGFMPRLQSLSMRQYVLDSAATSALISVLRRYSPTLTQLNLSACSFDASASNADARHALGDALGACDAVKTFVGQRSPDMHYVVLRAVEQQSGRAAALSRIDRVDIAGIFLPHTFVQRLAAIAARLRVLRVSDEPMDEDVDSLKGTHTSYAEQALFYHALYHALLNKHGSLESVIIAYGGVHAPPRRLVRRLAHALQCTYARFGKSADVMTPGDPDYPTAWRGTLLNHDVGPDGISYDLKVEETMYGNEQTSEAVDVYEPRQAEENEVDEDEDWAAYLEYDMEEEDAEEDDNTDGSNDNDEHEQKEDDSDEESSMAE
jgi:hypothetical protein